MRRNDILNVMIRIRYPNSDISTLVWQHMSNHYVFIIFAFLRFYWMKVHWTRNHFHTWPTISHLSFYIIDMPNLLFDIIMAMKDAIARSSLCLSYQPVIRNPWPKRKSYLFHRAKNIKKNVNRYIKGWYVSNNGFIILD